MKARLLMTGLLVAVSAGALSGCVVYPRGYGYEVDSVVVRPAPYYGPRYRDYRYYDGRRYWENDHHRDRSYRDDDDHPRW